MQLEDRVVAMVRFEGSERLGRLVDRRMRRRSVKAAERVCVAPVCKGQLPYIDDDNTAYQASLFVIFLLFVQNDTLHSICLFAVFRVKFVRSLLWGFLQALG